MDPSDTFSYRMNTGRRGHRWARHRRLGIVLRWSTMGLDPGARRAGPAGVPAEPEHRRSAADACRAGRRASDAGAIRRGCTVAGLSGPEPDFAHLAEGNARQARKRVAADVLIRDQTGRVLLVDPTYKPGWDLPGGMAEANESPRAAARRELREELGLDLEPGRPLAIEWVGPHGPWDDRITLVFDGGVLEPEVAAGLKVTDPGCPRRVRRLRQRERRAPRHRSAAAARPSRPGHSQLRLPRAGRMSSSGSIPVTWSSCRPRSPSAPHRRPRRRAAHGSASRPGASRRAPIPR